MSKLSTAVFRTSASIQNYSPRPKRAQLYELYAAVLGFKSYAALNAANWSNVVKTLTQIGDADIERRLNNRLKDLGLSTSFLKALSTSVSEQLKQLHADGSVSVLYQAAMELMLIRSTIPAASVPEKQELKRQLHEAASRGDSEAKLLFVAWLSSELAPVDSDAFDEFDEFDDGDFEGSEYWYQQRLKGAVLSPTAAEWADAYEKSLHAKQASEPLIQEFALSDLATPNVTQVLDESAEPNFCCSLDANLVIQLLENFYPPTPEYLSMAAWFDLKRIQNCSYEGLQSLFTETNSPVDKYAVYLFGLSQGVDITKDHFWLVDSMTGGEWDEYSAADVVGDHGVTLPNLNDAELVLAKKKVVFMQKLESCFKRN